METGLSGNVGIRRKANRRNPSEKQGHWAWVIVVEVIQYTVLKRQKNPSEIVLDDSDTFWLK